MEQLNFFSLFVATAIAVLMILLLKQKNYYWVALLIASLSFYWLVAHNKLFLIVAYSFIIYLCSLAAAQHKKSKLFFLLLVAASLLPLIGVKIIFSLSLVSSFSFLQTPIEYSGSNQFITIIPGLSFITFNGLSYLIDIRRGYINPEKNFLLVLLYLTFFPYVLSGPLHRAKSFFIQVKTKIEFNSSNLSLAFRCLLLGFFKSFVLGERFYSAWLDLQLANATGFFVLLQGLLFFLYLYCVFSSFIDISRGIAWLFNFPLETNFKNGVYASSSRRLFWQGWHITLNNWFRDYVFYPLMKKPFFRTSANGALFVCFLLIGLWHGVSWQFLLWGALNGIWVIMEIKFQKFFLFIPNNQRKWLGVIYHLFFASLLALIFTTDRLKETFQKLITSTNIPRRNIEILLHQSTYLLFFFAILHCLHLFAKNEKPEIFIGKLHPAMRWVIYSFTTLAIIFFGVRVGLNNYYFKF